MRLGTQCNSDCGTPNTQNGRAVEYLKPPAREPRRLKEPFRTSSEAQLKVLRLIEQQPSISQRRLAAELGISLGKTNYCVKALLNKGWLKARNFKKQRQQAGLPLRAHAKGAGRKSQAFVPVSEA